jgi:hypothetical protein
MSFKYLTVVLQQNPILFIKKKKKKKSPGSD